MMPRHENWNDELQGAAMNQSPATGGAPTNNAGPFLEAHQGWRQTPFSVTALNTLLKQLHIYLVFKNLPV